ncbi:MAG TPA: hypothetical protein VIM52_16645 [Stellaceae bacterium]
MSIRIASPLRDFAAALMREARSVFSTLAWARCRGNSLSGPRRCGADRAAVAGLMMLFTGLLVALEPRLAAHHPHPHLGAANRITLVRTGHLSDRQPSD